MNIGYTLFFNHLSKFPKTILLLSVMKTTDKMHRYFLPLLILLIASCGGEEKCKDCEVKKQDTVVAPVDDLEAAMAADTAVAPTKEAAENHAKIVKKYGEQWDFCKCVVANDSITDAAEKGKLTDKQYEQLMARWEYVDNKCKELTTFDNTTPDERDKHEKRVMKCLKQNGLKK